MKKRGIYLGKYEICTADLERTIANPLYEQNLRHCNVPYQKLPDFLVNESCDYYTVSSLSVLLYGQ